MSKTNEVNKNLLEFQKELEKIKTFSEMIEVAKNSNEKILNESCKVFEKVEKNYKDNISKSSKVLRSSVENATEIINSSQKKYKKEFNELKKIADKLLDESESLIVKTQKNSDEIVCKSQELHNAVTTLNQSTEELINKVGRIDFPAKFEKLDTTISGLSTTIQNVFSRLETGERNIKDEIINKNNSMVNYLEDKNRVINTKLNFLNIITTIIFLLLLFKLLF